jgi:hypothetical protein
MQGVEPMHSDFGGWKIPHLTEIFCSAKVYYEVAGGTPVMNGTGSAADLVEFEQIAGLNTVHHGGTSVQTLNPAFISSSP